MLGSYAAHDHRANLDQAKKACIRNSLGRRQVSAFEGLMDNFTLHLADSHQEMPRYRGRSDDAIGSL
jgi:hypothetical protein